MKTYKIVRMYFNKNIKTKTIRRNLSLEEAQAHCKDKETSSSTCKLPKNKKHTARYGDWFDGYIVEKIYSVWVGASEVNNYYLTLEDAIDLADEYKDDGYDDVYIRKELNEV
jgi:hypothetical protein|tara:strand:- start:235 stop:570 length:336 start_codon:yes stop_codon:yes gene_type:complete